MPPAGSTASVSPGSDGSPFEAAQKALRRPEMRVASNVLTHGEGYAGGPERGNMETRLALGAMDTPEMRTARP